MSKERCWNCKKVKGGVKLRACNDRLCEKCFQENEKALSELHARSVSDNTVSEPSDPEHKPNCCKSGCSVSADDPKIQCCVCASWYHGVCVGMSNNILSDILPFVDDIGWVCPTCRDAARSALQQLRSSHSKLCDATAELKENFRKIKAEVSSLQNKVGKLTARDGEFSAQLEQLKTDNENHRTAHPQPPVAWPTNEATNQVLTAVHKELSEKHRRQRNVVVTGLESSDTVADVDLFLQMCEDCMPLKPYVDKNKCRRLGKAQHHFLLCLIMKSLPTN